MQPLFKADPIIRPFQLGAVLDDLEQLCHEILHRVGEIQQYILYPHRVFKHHAWHIKIIGESAVTYVLINIGGYYQFVSDMKATRLSINVADSVDAFWFAYALADKLSVTPVIPTGVLGGTK